MEGNMIANQAQDEVLARLLWWGTCLACLVIALGMALGGVQQAGVLRSLAWSGLDLVKAGIALFILLPVARVVVMLALFVRARDYVYALVALFVLLIIVSGYLVA